MYYPQQTEFSGLIVVKSFLQQNERILSLFKTGPFEVVTHELVALVQKIRALDITSHLNQTLGNFGLDFVGLERS